MRLSLGGGGGEGRRGEQRGSPLVRGLDTLRHWPVCARSYQLLASFPLFTHLHVALSVAGMQHEAGAVHGYCNMTPLPHITGAVRERDAVVVLHSLQHHQELQEKPNEYN